MENELDEDDGLKGVLTLEESQRRAAAAVKDDGGNESQKESGDDDDDDSDPDSDPDGSGDGGSGNSSDSWPDFAVKPAAAKPAPRPSPESRRSASPAPSTRAGRTRAPISVSNQHLRLQSPLRGSATKTTATPPSKRRKGADAESSPAASPDRSSDSSHSPADYQIKDVIEYLNRQLEKYKSGAFEHVRGRPLVMWAKETNDTVQRGKGYLRNIRDGGFQSHLNLKGDLGKSVSQAESMVTLVKLCSKSAPAHLEVAGAWDTLCYAGATPSDDNTRLLITLNADHTIAHGALDSVLSLLGDGAAHAICKLASPPSQQEVSTQVLLKYALVIFPAKVQAGSDMQALASQALRQMDPLFASRLAPQLWVLGLRRSSWWRAVTPKSCQLMFSTRL